MSEREQPDAHGPDAGQGEDEEDGDLDMNDDEGGEVELISDDEPDEPAKHDAQTPPPAHRHNSDRQDEGAAGKGGASPPSPATAQGKRKSPGPSAGSPSKRARHRRSSKSPGRSPERVDVDVDMDVGVGVGGGAEELRKLKTELGKLTNPRGVIANFNHLPKFIALMQGSAKTIGCKHELAVALAGAPLDVLRLSLAEPMLVQMLIRWLPDIAQGSDDLHRGVQESVLKLLVRTDPKTWRPQDLTKANATAQATRLAELNESTPDVKQLALKVLAVAEERTNAANSAHDSPGSVAAPSPSSLPSPAGLKASLSSPMPPTPPSARRAPLPPLDLDKRVDASLAGAIKLMCEWVSPPLLKLPPGSYAAAFTREAESDLKKYKEGLKGKKGK